MGDIIDGVITVRVALEVGKDKISFRPPHAVGWETGTFVGMCPSGVYYRVRCPNGEELLALPAESYLASDPSARITRPPR